MNGLTIIETLSPIVFSEPGGIDAMLARLTAAAKAEPTDISTPAGRADLKRLVKKIGSSKAAFDQMGKELVAGWKDQAKVVDLERARVRDYLEALQAEVRKPLDEYEAAEAQRVADHQNAMQTIIDLATFSDDMPTSATVIERLTTYDALPDRDWQEFKQKAAAARSATFAKLQALKAGALAREAEAAETARLLAEKAAREQAERDARIAAEAAEKATREAEEKASAEALRVANETAERQRLADQARADALALAERTQRAADESTAKAERDRLAAVAQAEVDRLAAIDAERQRVADAAAAEERETARRTADHEHRKAINSEARAALIAAGLTEADGIKVVTAIFRGQIPHIAISY